MKIRGGGTAPLSMPMHLILSGALLLPSLISGPDLGVWTDPWVSKEFLFVCIPRKLLGSTTTISLIGNKQNSMPLDLNQLFQLLCILILAL